MQWYYAQGGQQIGPYDDATFNRLVANGTIREDTYVWSAGMPTWAPMKTLRAGGAPAVAAAPAMPAAQPAWPQAPAQPGYAQPAYAAPAGAMVYGGFWIRFLAIVIDGIILWIAWFTLFAVLSFGGLLRLRGGVGFQVILLFVQTAVAMAYETWFIAQRGATPGKILCHLKVVTAEGGPLSPAQSLGRYAAKVLSGFTLCIGFIMAAFDSQKRALHDLICNTRVIKQR